MDSRVGVCRRTHLALLETVKQCLDLANRIGRSATRTSHVHRLQWGGRALYDWLLGIGLSPAKSLTLGPIVVPAELFHHFLRGCIDGDGSIVTYIDRHHTRKNPTDVYTRLFVSLVSASSPFLEWVRSTVRELRGLVGHVSVRRTPGRHDLWRLRYAKAESVALLRWLYPSVDVPSLARKRDIAAAFLAPTNRLVGGRRGRPMVV